VSGMYGGAQALMAGGSVTTGGLTALVGKIFHTKKGAKTNGLDNTTQGRNGNDYGTSKTESRRSCHKLNGLPPEDS